MIGQLIGSGDGDGLGYCGDGERPVSSSQEDRSGCRCFLIGESEAVKRSTADLICAGHSGSWVAELDHPGQLSLWPLMICSCLEQ